MFANVQQGQGGCKYCATRGFSYTAPGIVYLVRGDAHYAVKIGVTTSYSRTDRVSHHTVEGWEVVGTWNVRSGEDAEAVETAILKWWRDDLGAPAALSKADMPQGGWTETASLLWVDVDATVARIQTEVDRLSEDDQNE